MAIEIFLNNLQKVRRKGNGKWMACCPCHSDRTPSLALKEDNGQVLIHCFGCGATGIDVCGALGIDQKELFPIPDHNYTHADGFFFNAPRKASMSLDQVLQSIHDESYVVYMIASDMLKNGIDTQTKERLLLAVSRISSAETYIRNN